MNDEWATEVALNTILPNHCLPLVYCALTPDTVLAPKEIEATPIICGIHTEDARDTIFESMTHTTSKEIVAQIEETEHVFISMELGRFFDFLVGGFLQAADLFMGPLVHESSLWTQIEGLVMVNLCDSKGGWNFMDYEYLNQNALFLANQRMLYLRQLEEYEWEYNTLISCNTVDLSKESVFAKMYTSPDKEEKEAALARAITNLKLKLI